MVAKRRTKKTTPARAPTVQQVTISGLKPHPRNYRGHPEDQLEHIKASIVENGFYRNVVVARDGTILAGHGVVEAATVLGRRKVPAIRLDLNPEDPRALKILTGDNEMAHLGVVDDRLLTELLGALQAEGELLGTGYDEAMLANLIFTTRPQSEIRDMNEAAAWAGAGMPQYEGGEPPIKLTISFRSEEDRKRYVDEFGIEITKTEAHTWSAWWPVRERDDVSAVQYDG